MPIVASLPPGAARRMVEEEGIGLVADAGDVEGLARCVKRMVEDRELRRVCRERMLSIREQYRPHIQVEKWRRILVEISLQAAAPTIERRENTTGGVAV